MTLRDDYRRQFLRDIKLRGWSVSELAERAKVGRATLSLFLNGRGNPSLDWIDRVLAAFRRSRPKKSSQKP